MATIQMYRRDMQRRGLTETSVSTLDSRVRSFQRWMDPRSILDATTNDVQSFLDARHMGGRTRYGWVSALHGFFDWAVREEFTDIDPTTRITRPKLRKGMPRPIPDNELAHSLRAATTMMHSWLSLAAYGGLRCAEVARVDRSDIMESEQLLRVLGKGQKVRLVPIHPIVRASLLRHGLPRKGPLFRRPMGDPYTPVQVSLEGAKFMRSIGVDATMHQLRHWFATKTYAECHDILVVQYLMGHADASTSAIYTAFSNADATAAVMALPKLAA